MKPHKHAEVIKAWADGAEIEIRMEEGWYTVYDPIWNSNDTFRIKPEPNPDFVAVGILELDVFPLNLRKLASYHTKFRVSERWEKDNVRVTFDGETGKLKSAEVLK